MGNKGNRDKLVSVLVLLVGLGLRLINLNQSLWLDEAIEWWAVKSFGLRELLTGYMAGDFNPPGHHLLMWFWVRMFGDSEISLRMPSVLFGLGTIWWIYKIGKTLDRGDRGDRGRVGLLAAGMAAVNGLLIYYSQEGRMYAMAAFFVSGAMYWFLKMNKTDKTDKTDRKDYIIYCLLLAGALYSHYLTWLMLPFLAIWGLKYVLPVLLTIPWWPMLWKQLQAGLAVAGNPVWADLSRTNFKNLALVAVKFVTGRVPWPEAVASEIVIGSLVIGYWVLAGRGVIREIREIGGIRGLRGTRRAIIIFWAFGPLVLGSLIGFIIPVFTYFRFLFVAPAVIVLAARGLEKLGILGKLGLLGALAIFSLSYLFRPEFQREDWRGTVAELHRQESSPTVIIYPAVRPPFDYYDRRSERSVVIERPGLAVARPGLNKTAVWYIPYAQAIFDPEDTVRKELSSLGYVGGYERHFRGVTLEKWEIF